MTVSSIAARAESDDVQRTVLNRLSVLKALPRGLPPYYQQMIRDDDPVVRVAALVALLELRAIWSDQAELVLSHCNYGGVKRRAFPFFMEVQELDLARRAAETPSEDIDSLLTRRMQAELALDHESAVALDRDLFLAHGTPDYLWDGEQHAEWAGGWKACLPLAAVALVAKPMEPNSAFLLMSKIRAGSEPGLLTKVCDLFADAKVFQAETAIFRAALLLDAGEGERAATWLKRMPEKFPSPLLTELVLQLRGEALNKTGDYQAAYRSFVLMNEAGKSATVDPKTYAKSVRSRAALTFEPLAADPREANCPTLTGFPRSATTLLENILEAHPQVEAFEEIPAFARLARLLERFAPKDRAVPADIALRARDAYFDEISRQSKKPAAAVRVDKMPTVASDAVLLKNIFPDKRYIFSIRHPYDVVLSCFRQTFVANAAMENFRTIADAAALYDFTMTQWFAVHGLDDPAVSYVRYEDLVTRFQPTVERVLDFLGVEWDDSIHDFAASADKRFAKTPSYKKVRSGLSIGVQSSWKNYDFLWNTKETQVLKKWVSHFGYDA